MSSDENQRKVVTKHPSCVEVGECRPNHRASKNTHRWCKGRVGIPHTWEWRRGRNELELEQRFGMTFNRVTEHPVCFGCEKVDFRRRSYCRLCGEPWPQLHHEMADARAWRVRPCAGCGAPWSLRPRVAGVRIVSGAVRP